MMLKSSVGSALIKVAGALVFLPHVENVRRAFNAAWTPHRNGYRCCINPSKKNGWRIQKESERLKWLLTHDEYVGQRYAASFNPAARLLMSVNDLNVACTQAMKKFGITSQTKDIDGLVNEVVDLVSRLCPSVSQTQILAQIAGRDFEGPFPVDVPCERVLDAMCFEDAQSLFRLFTPDAIARRLRSSQIEYYLNNPGEAVQVDTMFDEHGTPEEAQKLLSKFRSTNYWLDRELSKTENQSPQAQESNA